MVTLVVKNLPDDLYKRLKDAASAHQCSINTELIRCLETALQPKLIDTEERLSRFRILRPQVEEKVAMVEHINNLIF